jgi:hypothetical protein
LENGVCEFVEAEGFEFLGVQREISWEHPAQFGELFDDPTTELRGHVRFKAFEGIGMEKRITVRAAITTTWLNYLVTLWTFD